MSAEIVSINRTQALERLAELDAILDIMDWHNEDEIRAEREHLAWLAS